MVQVRNLFAVLRMNDATHEIAAEESKKEGAIVIATYRLKMDPGLCGGAVDAS